MSVENGVRPRTLSLYRWRRASLAGLACVILASAVVVFFLTGPVYVSFGTGCTSDGVCTSGAGTSPLAWSPLLLVPLLSAVLVASGAVATRWTLHARLIALPGCLGFVVIAVLGVFSIGVFMVPAGLAAAAAVTSMFGPDRPATEHGRPPAAPGSTGGGASRSARPRGARIANLSLFGLLTAVCGAGMVFLSLETAGVALILAVPLFAVLRRGAPSTWLVAVLTFGPVYVAGLVRFLTTDASPDSGVRAYIASQVAAGVCLVVLGVVFTPRPAAT